MVTLKQQLELLVQEKYSELEYAKSEQQTWSKLSDMIDQFPVPDGAEIMGTSYWVYYDYYKNQELNVSLFYTAASIPAFLPLLELIESKFGDVNSHDDETGARIFSAQSNEYNLDLRLFVTPAENGVCQKILVGEDVTTETKRTPRYKLQCN